MGLHGLLGWGRMLQRGCVARRAIFVALGCCAATAAGRAAADTMIYALTQAYQNNQQLSAQRSVTREADENVNVLQATLRQTRVLCAVGEGTRTDVAQAESRLASGRFQLQSAESNYATSKAQYRQVIGVEPGRLAPGTTVDRFSPRTLAGAV